MTDETTVADPSDISGLNLREAPARSRYGALRLAALWHRTELLEATIESAETDLRNDVDRSAVVAELFRGQTESLIGAMLCSRETTDEQLDFWIPRIAEHERKYPRAAGEGPPVRRSVAALLGGLEADVRAALTMVPDSSPELAGALGAVLARIQHRA